MADQNQFCWVLRRWKYWWQETEIRVIPINKSWENTQFLDPWESKGYQKQQPDMGKGTWMIQGFVSKSKCHPRALKISWITASVLALEQSAFYRLNSMLPHPRPMFYPSGNVSNHRNTLAWKWQSTHEVFWWKEYQTEVMSKIHSPELS